MQQKDLMVGQEVAVSGYRGGYRRAKVKRLGAHRGFSDRADGVEVEFLADGAEEHDARAEVGDTRVVQSRHIEMTWETAAPIVAARRAKVEEKVRQEKEATERIAEIERRVVKALAVSGFPQVARLGRELQRDAANRVIRQPHGDRMEIDTEVVEMLLNEVENSS